MTYTSLMNADNASHRFTEALKTFLEARKSGRAGLVAFNIAIKSLTELGRHDDVKKLWLEMPKLGLQPDVISLGVFLRSLAIDGRVSEIEEVLSTSKIEPSEVTWRTVIQELYHGGLEDPAMKFFERGHKAGKLPVWSADDLNKLDLHLHNSAVACCAVLYFLAKRAEGKIFEDLEIIVGRQLHLNPTNHTTLSEAVMNTLKELNLNFEEKNGGGVLVI